MNARLLFFVLSISRKKGKKPGGSRWMTLLLTSTVELSIQENRFTLLEKEDSSDFYHHYQAQAIRRH